MGWIISPLRRKSAAGIRHAPAKTRKKRSAALD